MIKVIKRTGDAVNLELSKILSAVRRANFTTSEEITPTTLDVFTSAILAAIDNAVKDNVIQVEVIQDLVEGCLMGVGLHQTAKNYILYRSERNKGREEFLMLYNIIQSEDIKRILYTSRKTYNLPFRQLYDKYVSYKKDTNPELETLIKAAAECTNMDNPKWDNVAGRLYYHKILVESKRNRANLGIDTNKHKEFYTKLIELGLYGEELGVYTEDELAYIIENSEEFHKEVQKYITYSAADLYYKRYLVRNYNGNILENIIQMFTRVGMFLAIPEASNKMYAALNFIKELATFRVTVATPTLSNAGKPKAQLSSCFIDTIEDSLDGIYESLHEFAKVSKWGGGMGIYMGKVRAVGSPIRGFKGKSGGIIRWVKLFNDTAVAVDQLGQRNGSCAITLDIWHKDMPEFLQIRTNNGDDRMKAHDVFPAVSVPDLFWKLVDTNIEENWYMFCPHEVKTIMGFSLEDYYGEEWEAKYKECVNNENLPRRTMSVKDMIRLIIKSSVETGTPFIFNRDTVNRANPNKHKGVIYSSNLCVSGDTRILTKLGYKRIQEVVDQNLEIWNGKEWSLSPIRKTSDGSMLLRIHFSNGQYIDCTEYHKFYKQEGFSGNGREIQVEAKDLQIGDRLIKFDLPIIEGTETLEHSYDNGFFTGDGTVVGKYKNYARIYLYNNKKVLVKYFSSIRNWRSSSNRLEAETNELRPKFFVPNSDFTINSRIEWFMGLCDADGTIARNGNTCSLQITSINKEFLVETMEMLNTLGIDCKVVKGFEEGFRKMPTHRVDITHKKYYCNKSYRLVIGNYSLVKLVKLGFKPHRLVITDNIPNRDATQFIKVTKVEHLVGFHPTYCVNEPKEHKVIFNSVLTGNCVEIAQNMSSFTKEETDNIALSDKDYLVQETNKAGDYVVCNLASIVLSRFAGWHKNDNIKEALRTTVHTVVNMLDNGITMNNLPSEYANITNSIYRAIGIGTSGYHHLLALEGIAWESEEHLKYMDKLFEFINMCAIEASSNLAIQKGSYKVFEGSDWNTGKYFDDRGYNSEEWDSVKSNAMLGMRNAYLMAIAPTGSTSILVGTSPGIDPIQNKYFLEEKKGSIVPRVAPDLDDKTWWLYKEAHNINHEWTIKAAGIRQRHIDQSQSLNLFINHSYSFRDILNLYLLAWKEGVKTLYYIRSKSLEVEECVSCSS